MSKTEGLAAIDSENSGRATKFFEIAVPRNQDSLAEHGQRRRQAIHTRHIMTRYDALQFLLP
jgi:hypothetical protein